MSKKRKKKNKTKDTVSVKPRPHIKLNSAADLSWTEILDKYNNGKTETIFGTIIL
jgi:hypothetical protein